MDFIPSCLVADDQLDVLDFPDGGEELLDVARAYALRQLHDEDGACVALLRRQGRLGRRPGPRAADASPEAPAAAETRRRATPATPESPRAPRTPSVAAPRSFPVPAPKKGRKILFKRGALE